MFCFKLCQVYTYPTERIEPLETILRNITTRCDNGVQITIKTYLMKTTKKEMFYLTTHSTHFIYGYMVSENNKQTHTTIH